MVVLDSTLTLHNLTTLSSHYATFINLPSINLIINIMDSSKDQKNNEVCFLSL